MKVFSKNPVISSIRPRRIYPFYIIPFGFFQTVLQLFRKVQLPSNVQKTSYVLDVENDGEILLDVYVLSHSKVMHKDSINESDHISVSGLSRASEGLRENVLLIHGLNGSSKSTYIMGMAKVFLKRGCRVFCYNARGAQIPPKSNLFSHHGLTSDVRFTVEHILDVYGGNLSLVGFSLGSNWVTKFLGEYSHPRLRMGVSICCPFDFAFLNEHFRAEYYITKFVNYCMSRNYKRYLRKSMLEAVDLNGCHYLDEIDTALLGILGKDDLAEFYRENSCISYISKITVPCLFISASDDPVIPAKVIPFEACIENINTGVILLKGGHLGFFTNCKETMAEIITGEFYDRILSERP